MKYIFTIAMFIFSTLIYAQYDEIIKKNGDTIICEVIEINPDEIRFSLGSGERKSIFNTDRNKVRSILVGGNNITLNSKDAVRKKYSTLWKFNPIGSFIDNFGITLEKQLSEFISVEAEAIYVSQLSSYYNFEGDGFNFRLGSKFYLEESIKGPMHGSYVRTELLVSSVSYNHDPNPEIPNFTRALSKSIGITLSYGKQKIYAGSLVIDAFAGAGLGIQINNIDKEISDFSRRGGWWQGTSRFPAIFISGLRIGFTTK